MEFIVNNDNLDVKTSDDIDRALAGLKRDAEALIVLFRSEEEHIMAEGVPSVGLVVTYADQEAGISKIAVNRALDLRTVTNILHAFMAEGKAWQGETLWEDAQQQQEGPGCLLALAKLVVIIGLSILAFSAAARLAHPLMDSLIFYPICESYHPSVVAFERGVFTGVGQETAFGLCRYADGTVAPLELANPENAAQNSRDADGLQNLIGMTAIIPVFIALAILLFRKREVKTGDLV